MKKILKYMVLAVEFFNIVGITSISYGMIPIPANDSGYFYSVIEANQDLFYDALNVSGQNITFNGRPVKILPIRFFHRRDISNDRSYIVGALTELTLHFSSLNQIQPTTKTFDQTKLKKRPQKTIESSIIDRLGQIQFGRCSLLDVILCRRQNLFPCNADIFELLKFVREYNTTQLNQETEEIKLLVFDLAWETNDDTSESDISHMFKHHVACPGHHGMTSVAPGGDLHQSYFVFPERLDLSRDSQRIMITMLLLELGDPQKGSKIGTISFNNPADSVQYCYVPENSAALVYSKKISTGQKKGGKGTPCVEIVPDKLSIMKIYIR